MDFLLWLQEIRTPTIEDAALVISLLCDKILIMLVFCWIFWCRDKKTAYGLAFSFAVSGLAVQGLKLGFRVDRPFVRNLRIKPVEAALETATGYSFPSGHTQIATSLLGYTAASVKSVAVKILSVVFILLVMLSRMVLGVHTPMDVTVSFIITMTTVVLVKHFQKKSNGRFKKFFLILGAVLSAVFFCFSVFLVSSGRVPFELAYDGIVISVIGVTFFISAFVEMFFIKFDPAATFSGNQGFWQQFKKFVVGFLILMIIYFGLDSVDGVIIDGLKYVAVFTWICCLYPIVIKKLCKRV